MWGVDWEAAWVTAQALQKDDNPLVEGEVVRHPSDGRNYSLDELQLFTAICHLLPQEGDPNFVQEFPIVELVRPQHINYAMLMCSNNTVINGDLATTEEVGNKIIEILKGLK